MVFFVGKPPPKLPRYMIQKTWGMPSTLLDRYIELDEFGHCIVGGDKCLSVSLFYNKAKPAKSTKSNL